jgi:hypothetical protein
LTSLAASPAVSYAAGPAPAPAPAPASAPPPVAAPAMPAPQAIPAAVPAIFAAPAVLAVPAAAQYAGYSPAGYGNTGYATAFRAAEAGEDAAKLNSHGNELTPESAAVNTTQPKEVSQSSIVSSAVESGVASITSVL